MQVKASYKLSEEFKKGPAKPKKVAKAKVSLFTAATWSDVTSKSGIGTFKRGGMQSLLACLHAVL